MPELARAVLRIEWLQQHTDMPSDEVLGISEALADDNDDDEDENDSAAEEEKKQKKTAEDDDRDQLDEDEDEDEDDAGGGRPPPSPAHTQPNGVGAPIANGAPRVNGVSNGGVGAGRAAVSGFANEESDEEMEDAQPRGEAPRS
jgi:hypothetical protein